MARRVLSVTAKHIKQHRLDTHEGRVNFLRSRQEDHEDWDHALHIHPVTGDAMLVLDHKDPEKPLHALKPYHHGGQKLVHAGGRPKVTCADPECEKEAVYGTSHCPVHFPLPIGAK